MSSTLLSCLLGLSCLLAASTWGGESSAPPPLPEGATGLAAKYLKDQGLEKDSAVVFANGLETVETGGLRGVFDNAYGDATVTREAARVHSGSRAVQLRIARANPEKADGAAVHVHFDPGYDKLFLRYYQMFGEETELFHGGAHNGASIDAGPLGASSGIAANGSNHFQAQLDTYRHAESMASPGELCLYAYHPEQRHRFGEQWFPSGRRQPKSGNPEGDGGLFGPFFQKRPDLIPQRGKWICFELMLQTNTPGKRDGRAAFWVDGKLAGDFPNLIFRATDKLKINRLRFQLYSMNRLANKPCLMWYDDIVAATSYIGPLSEAPARPMADARSGAPENASAPAQTGQAAQPAGPAPTAAVQPAQPNPEQQARALERYAELKAGVIAEIAKGRRELVFVELLGKPSKIRVAGADAKSLDVDVQGNRFPLPWDQMPPSQFAGIARCYGADKVALYEYCLGMGLRREAELALLR
ncbi:MAG: hypothetical protein M5U26_19075 [Planctomycetota bacterium]|nr:hypothetical protein [Planctomycetota bacterium]